MTNNCSTWNFDWRFLDSDGCNLVWVSDNVLLGKAHEIFLSGSLVCGANRQEYGYEGRSEVAVFHVEPSKSPRENARQ